MLAFPSPEPLRPEGLRLFRARKVPTTEPSLQPFVVFVCRCTQGDGDYIPAHLSRMRTLFLKGVLFSELCRTQFECSGNHVERNLLMFLENPRAALPLPAADEEPWYSLLYLTGACLVRNSCLQVFKARAALGFLSVGELGSQRTCLCCSFSHLYL